MNLKFRPLFDNQRVLAAFPSKGHRVVSNLVLGGLVLGSYSVVSYSSCLINQSCMHL